MRLETLLLELKKRGVKLKHDRGNISAAGPKGALTPELKEALAINKENLIACLSRPDLNDIPVKAEDSQVSETADGVKEEERWATINGHHIKLGEIAFHLRRQTGVREVRVDVATNADNGHKDLVAYIVPWSGLKKSMIQEEDTTEADSTDRLDQLKAAAEIMERKYRHEQAAGLRNFQLLWEAMEAVCPIVMSRALAHAGAFTDDQRTESVDSLIERHGLNRKHRPLLSQWLEVLAQHGLLEPDGNEGRYRAPTPFDFRDLDRRMEAALAAFSFDSTLAPFAQYFQQSARHATSILRNEKNPLEFLFPGGQTNVVEAWYQLSASADLQNRVAAEAIRQYAAMLPQDQKIEVLEVGAGVGGTSASLLPVLPSQRTHYRYTDVSMFFMENAKKKFSGFPFIEYGLFHIDRRPESQGYQAEQFDIIVAANVLHNAVFIDTTLRNLRSLLKPGGILVLIEATVNNPVLMLTVGFIESFGHYKDHRKQVNRPLMSALQWRECLQEAGFSHFTAVPEQSLSADVMWQQVMIAEVPRQMPLLQGDTLSEALSRSLPQHMIPCEYRFMEQLPIGSGNE